MSNTYMYPNWDQKDADNFGLSNDQRLTRQVLRMLKIEHPISTSKYIAITLGFKNHYKPKHWLYRGSVINAYEFLQILTSYERIRCYFGFKKIPNSRNPFIRKKNTEEIQKKILQFVEKSPSLSLRSLSHILGISVKATEYALQLLKGKGKIVRVGSRRNGRWQTKK